MSKLMLVLGSFGLGVLSSFLLIMVTGSHASTLPQATSIVGPAARPTVPALGGPAIEGSEFTGSFTIDGIDCHACVFHNGRLEYWGGPIRCIDCAVDKGAVTLEMRGAASNALSVLF